MLIEWIEMEMKNNQKMMIQINSKKMINIKMTYKMNNQKVETNKRINNPNKMTNLSQNRKISLIKKS